jgi:hypothetical protein
MSIFLTEFREDTSRLLLIALVAIALVLSCAGSPQAPPCYTGPEQGDAIASVLGTCPRAALRMGGCGKLKLGRYTLAKEVDNAGNYIKISSKFTHFPPLNTSIFVIG